jgi:hypothetical protein
MGEFALAQSDSRSRTHFEREGWEIDLPRAQRGELEISGADSAPLVAGDRQQSLLIEKQKVGKYFQGK